MPVTHVKDDSHYQSILSDAGEKLVLIDFTATWCGPCKHMAPIFEELSEKYQSAVFVKVDVDECPDIAQEHDVKAMPTFVFIRAKKELSRIRGADPASLEAKLKEYATASIPFSGAGQRLGGTIDDANNEPGAGGGWLSSLIGGATGTTLGSGGSSTESENSAENEALAFSKLCVDESSPCTKINLRLVDGSKFTLQLNLSHPVSKIREFICTARPVYSSSVFCLMTTFPNKEITDEGQTVQEANIANSVVIQKLK